MGHRSHSSPIKKERLKLVLKEKGMTIQSLCDALNCNRTAFSRAINKGYLDSSILDDAAKFLDVNLEFLDGRYPLKKIIPNCPDYENLKDKVSPSGYDIPPYGSSIMTIGSTYYYTTQSEMTLLSAIMMMGEIGIRKDFNSFNSETINFDKDFVFSNSGYLIKNIMPSVIETIVSIYDKAPSYLDWKLNK